MRDVSYNDTPFKPERVSVLRGEAFAGEYEPVTVAAEQGLLGLLVYFALIAVALGTLSRGLFNAPPAGGADLGDRPSPNARGGGTKSATGPAGLAARAAVLAAFVALLVHTLAYAGFFEDPITWVLLAVGASLAHAGAPTIRKPA